MHREPGLTRDELAKHKVPIYTLTAPVRGWHVDRRGNAADAFTIPAGAKMVNVTRETCHGLLSTYAEDRSVADVLFPDGRHSAVFFSLKDAAKALPEHVPEVTWCAESQTYELVEQGTGDGRDTP